MSVSIETYLSRADDLEKRMATAKGAKLKKLRQNFYAVRAKIKKLTIAEPVPSPAPVEMPVNTCSPEPAPYVIDIYRIEQLIADRIAEQISERLFK